MDLIKRIHPKGDFLNFDTSNAVEQENDFLKNVIQEKDYIIQKYEIQINELEEKVSKLDTVTKQLATENNNAKAMNEMMVSYENLLSKIISESDINTQEKQATENHLNQLNGAFKDLMSKYEQAKTVIFGLEQNEFTLEKQTEMYQELLMKMEEKYIEFKNYASEKLNEANAQLVKNNREYINEISKLKAKIIQSQLKINELVKVSSRSKLGSSVLNNSCTNESIFEPLVTNFK